MVAVCSTWTHSSKNSEKLTVEKQHHLNRSTKRWWWRGYVNKWCLETTHYCSYSPAVLWQCEEEQSKCLDCTYMHIPAKHYAKSDKSLSPCLSYFNPKRNYWIKVETCFVNLYYSKKVVWITSITLFCSFPKNSSSTESTKIAGMVPITHQSAKAVSNNAGVDNFGLGLLLQSRCC